MNAPKVFNKNHGDAPKDAVYIGRGSPWGNSFVIGVDGDRDEVCDLFAASVEKRPKFKAWVKRTLRGRDLVCFCKPLRCHGDTFLKIANEDEGGADHGS